MRMTVHVDDPLVIGLGGPNRVLFEWLGQRVSVKCLETFDPVRVLKYLRMVYYRIPGSYLETILPGYTEGMASMMGVLHAETPATPGMRTRHRRRQTRSQLTHHKSACTAPSWAKHTRFSEPVQMFCTLFCTL